MQIIARRRALHFGVVIITVISLSACASTTVEEDGTTNVTGFVSMKIAPVAPSSAFAGHVTDMRTLGITTYSTPSGTGLGIGFMRILAGFIEDETEVIGSPYEIR